MYRLPSEHSPPLSPLGCHATLTPQRKRMSRNVPLFCRLKNSFEREYSPILDSTVVPSDYECVGCVSWDCDIDWSFMYQSMDKSVPKPPTPTPPPPHPRQDYLQTVENLTQNVERCSLIPYIHANKTHISLALINSGPVYVKWAI